MKQILVASDLSPRSHNAVERAAQLANQHGAHLTVLRVIEKDVPPDLASKHCHGQKAVLESYVRGIDGLGNIAYDVRVHFGKAWRCVVSLAQELDADLIVVGQHKNGLAGNPIWGSTMDIVIRRSHVPTLIAASKKPLFYKHIVAGIASSEASAKALEYALHIAPQARAHAMHAKRGIDVVSFHKRADCPPPEERLLTVLHEIDAHDRTELLIEDGSPYAALGRLVKDDGEHLLALGVYNRLGMGPMRGLIRLCARLPPCDVLLVQSECRKELEDQGAGSINWSGPLRTRRR